MADIKVKIKVGDSEIEAEGPKGDVEGILKVWWSSLDGMPERPADGSDALRKREQAPAKRTRHKTAHAKPVADRGGNGEAKFDANDVANQIKQHEHFRKYRDRILHGNNRYNKVALIFYLVEDPLTSGDVDRVLAALGVKIGVGNVSTVIGKHSSNFMNSTPRKMGGTAPRYRLTSPARSEFEAVLNESA